MQLRIFISCMVLITVGFIWEGLWWQEVINPASVFGDPPQWLYQPVMLLASGYAAYQWYTTRQRAWFVCSAVLAISILNIPYLYYRNEALGAPSRSGLAIYWSLPYLWSSIMMVTASACTIVLCRRKHFGVQLAAYAIIMVNVLIRLRPFRPTSQLYDLIGAAGAGVIIAGFLAVVLCAQQTISHRYSATMATLSGLLLYAFSGLFGIATFVIAGLSTDLLWQMFLGGYRHPPALLGAVSFLLAAFSLDVWQRPVLSAGLHAVVLYGLTNVWIAEGAVLSLQEQCTAVVAVLCGAWMAFGVHKRIVTV